MQNQTKWEKKQTQQEAKQKQKTTHTPNVYILHLIWFYQWLLVWTTVYDLQTAKLYKSALQKYILTV